MGKMKIGNFGCFGGNVSNFFLHNIFLEQSSTFLMLLVHIKDFDRLTWQNKAKKF